MSYPKNRKTALDLAAFLSLSLSLFFSFFSLFRFESTQFDQIESTLRFYEPVPLSRERTMSLQQRRVSPRNTRLALIMSPILRRFATLWILCERPRNHVDERNVTTAIFFIDTFFRVTLRDLFLHRATRTFWFQFPVDKAFEQRFFETARSRSSFSWFFFFVIVKEW